MLFRKRTLILMLIDALLINLAAFGSFYLRFDEGIPLDYYQTYYHTAIGGTILYLAVFYVFGLYNRLWQYASTGELLSIVYAVSVGTGGTVAAVYFYGLSNADTLSYIRMPHTAAVLLWLAMVFLIGGSRFIWRILQENAFDRHVPGSQKQVLIVGAGDAGVLAARELKNRNYRDGRPIGFIDDNHSKQKLQLLGIPVLGTRLDIARVVKGHNVDEVIIAMPSASGEAVREIVQICEKLGVILKIMPGVYDIISGDMNVKPIRQVQVEDLLGRDPVSVDLEEVAGYVAGETVIITGAGGSIGSEICRQIARFNPGRLVLLGHGENTIFDIEQELRSEHPGIDYITEILDVKDREKVFLIFERYKPGVVFHAAAHKHVPLMERNPEEALKNNVVGTQNLAEAADEVKVKTFVSISTDKAVNPTSVMGATKRTSEMIIQSLDLRSQTKFVAVRFGNVLGSRGSVIPTFKRQIAQGGPVTVTHPDMVRYFMTIPEAAQLVIQAGAMARGGEIFILDMGKPVKIVDLAKDLIRLSGFEPDVDIKIQFTGIRPGEKLFEELLTAEEGVTSTKHSRIFVAKPNNIDVKLLEELTHIIRERGSFLTRDEVIKLLQTVIPAFRKKTEKVVVNQ
ncbi:polysaccharide biosynthesis protein [Desulfosporosinus hippei]|uniref:NDP-sugar epimerase, includes UDP-GlcNAc-inverting 4,6-dehydratase FlaA1 and capsular polysaccharide biosynthesis protein EpsC n=1 Tax=Desulfosporosinus hippei DSM 8344 TaxID=1121419 RepID=A0A1G7U7J0_9FIRM|nr:nucleoside-diphosphate sugar epimerase/dehydratase [Desulfosporosinus hippei]SDG43423.1 NDP-sugar epimerase, includes UDP-GlcNAc-inverting 4,6-dehydratase FlaA1 and capsular polysaccharide biosynthesis protein EpsC [Desulfosporosinus hippei DSM 8344]